MAKGIIIIIFVLLIFVIAGVLIFFLFKINHSDEPDNIPTKDVLIKAYDDEGKVVISNFTVKSNYSTQEITTRNDSYAKIQVGATDSKITLVSNNEGVYYRSIEDFYSNTIHFNLKKIGTPVLYDYEGTFNDTTNFFRLYINTNYTVQKVSMCIRWSVNVIEVSNNKYYQIRNLTSRLDCEKEGYTWINATEDCNMWCKAGAVENKVTNAHCSVDYVDKLPPKRLENKVDKCYYMEQDIIKGNNLIIDLNYKAYNNTNEYDFVKVYIIDSDIDSNGNFRFEDDKGEDIGAKDVEFEIK